MEPREYGGDSRWECAVDENDDRAAVGLLSFASSGSDFLVFI
ncbi:MAG: hypothetical protein Q4F38_10315 [Akkermansia sp.]|nr:hypothetical protein [Akkermansia sp.]